MNNISRRDYFAGQALAGMLANRSTVGPHEAFATDAFKCADAMIEASGEAEEKTCEWVEGSCCGKYHTECGQLYWNVTHNGLRWDTTTELDDKAKICMYCGGRVVVKGE